MDPPQVASATHASTTDGALALRAILRKKQAPAQCRGAKRRFTEFGPSQFMPRRGRMHSLVVHNDFAEFRQQLRESCPRRAGVYGMVDRHGTLVYIGVSRRLRTRLLTYFQGGETIRKERCVAAHARTLVWEVVGHEFAAQLRELELIRRFQPRLNVQGRWPTRPLGYIYLSQEDAPRLRLARRVPMGVRFSWGPLGLGRRIREAVEAVNRLFKLCDCSSNVAMRFADQRELFPLDLRLECLRGEIGTCLGPCAGRCTRGAYAAQLSAARAFLDGDDSVELARLESTMHEASAQQQYERAANLHETLARLESLSNSLALLRRPPVPGRFIYPVRMRGRSVWYMIASSKVVGAAAQPTGKTRRAAERCLQLIDRAFRESPIEPSQVDRHAKHIVANWFRKHPDELSSAMSPVAAREHCVRLLARHA